MKPLLLRLDMSIKWLCKQARHSEVTKGRMLERGKTAYLVKETVPRSVTVERADSPCKSRNSLLSGGFFFCCAACLYACSFQLCANDILDGVDDLIDGISLLPEPDKALQPQDSEPQHSSGHGDEEGEASDELGNSSTSFLCVGK